jgi:hypothetical protein
MIYDLDGVGVFIRECVEHDTLFRDFEPKRVIADPCHARRTFQSTFTHQVDYWTSRPQITTYGSRRRSLAMAGVITQIISASKAPASGTQPWYQAPCQKRGE